MSDSIATLVRATALCAALLRGGAEIPAIHIWRARCSALVETLRQAMQDAQYPAALIDEASLAQSVLLDELTLRALPLAQHTEWSRESLQMRFHRVRDGASRVWERIDALLDKRHHDQAALELYGILLELGFSGGRADADACRRRVKLAVSRLPGSDTSAPVLAKNIGSSTRHPKQAFIMTFAVRYRALLVCFTLFVIGLMWLCIPRDSQPSSFAALGLVSLTAFCATALLAYRRSPAGHNNEAISLDTARELPVILVAGPYAAAAFEGSARMCTLRRTSDAVWMLVRTPDELAASIATIKISHQRLPDAVLMPVVPDGDRDDAQIRQEFSRWRYELDRTEGYRAAALPCYIAIYACLGAGGDAAASPIWFGDVMGASTTEPEIQHARHAASLIRSQLDQASLESMQPALAARRALGHAVVDWLEDVALLSILSSLANTAPLSLRGLLLSDIGYAPTHAGAWTRWLNGKTGLRPCPIPPKRQPLPLPKVPVRAFVERTPESGQRRPHWLASYAVAASAALVVASIGVPVWMMNSRPDSKRGVAAGFGGAWYQDEASLAALAHSGSKSAQREGVTIDNLSLFDSGKTTLKPGAELKLKAAIDLILANPGKRILIAGHTDDVGTSAANLMLSEARARAIRDWFVDNASLPVTRFAIQGYGDTRPLASNADSRGREMNRRVEITLVPDSRAD
ncbi:DotU family type IV/VI secretion system protein [Paraburkholderia sp. ZP32-5]|uniref:DotU family type IV/VI secretion system protein n=1 Tax=Paraburkholderia sp. ZP32-5 TaxID=2883245 RepID=UPI001F170FD1|nr:DotU family type IV/VI secretion system protein [Paraburkholderia sp. ZP32-5]